MDKLQEFICTKINHDIIGHVGAVCNAVELLEEDDMEFIEEIKSVLKISSFVLASRLKYYRIAFGLSNAQADNIDNIIKSYVQSVASKNYPINISVEAFDKEFLKPILLIIMIVCEIIYKGGEIFLRGNKLEVKAFAYNKEKLDNLQDLSSAKLAPANCAYFYLYELLGEVNKNLSVVRQDEERLIIEVV